MRPRAISGGLYATCLDVARTRREALMPSVTARNRGIGVPTYTCPVCHHKIVVLTVYYRQPDRITCDKCQTTFDPATGGKSGPPG